MEANSDKKEEIVDKKEESAQEEKPELTATSEKLKEKSE